MSRLYGSVYIEAIDGRNAVGRDVVDEGEANERLAAGENVQPFGGRCLCGGRGGGDGGRGGCGWRLRGNGGGGGGQGGCGGKRRGGREEGEAAYWPLVAQDEAAEADDE